MTYIVLTIIAAAVVLAIVAKKGLKRVTIFEYQRGLKYSRGKFKQVVDPGQYWYVPFFSAFVVVDVRPRFLSISGQEVLSSDGVTLKVSLAANYEIVDPYAAVNKVQNSQEALYLELQLALRQIIGSTDIDTVLNNRDEISKTLMNLVAGKAGEIGLKLISVDLKDIMFPGKLKEIFAQVVNARKEGLAALEKARGETAALRSLANAARMIESNPNLMQLRLLQAVGESSGNTLILGMPAQTTAVPFKIKEADREKGEELPPESSRDSDPTGSAGEQ